MRGVHRSWACRCACGRSVVCFATNLKRGLSTRCSKCRNLIVGESNSTHGHTRGKEISRLYGIWCGIKRRCFNKSDRAFADYGAKGITIAPEWRNDFEAFADYVGERPSPDHSIDRIRNSGNYEPGNVRWATRIEQANNKRNNHWIEHDGTRDTLAGWCRRTGLKHSTLIRRLKENWPLSRALQSHA
jgi:hypothetical protein